MNSKWKNLFLLMITMLIFLTACDDQSFTGPLINHGLEEEKQEEMVMDNSIYEESVNEEQPFIQATLTFDGVPVNATFNLSETAQAFIEQLPLTLTMNRYADREYYAAITPLPEAGEAIPNFENGDITYYTAGQSLAVFFANEEISSQDHLLRIGRITSDLSLFEAFDDSVTVRIELAERNGENEMTDDTTISIKDEHPAAEYDFTRFDNIEITGLNLADLNNEELAVLYQQARICQAMTTADIEELSELILESKVFTHMSGRQQTRAEYFADIEDGSLRYFTIGIENPVIEISDDLASITYTSILNADAYGAKGTYRMKGTHWYMKQADSWIAVNAPAGE
ncbi:cyclophilin-like fold protein [Dielma fastidiosa]|uniref:Cyclophilin-like fold protein n=1 Tax=Dielma fastidiosa TaxID=1034346 RepID=A0AB35ULZ7_9FIRM|nr:cyclophilin-like fold protein [Dielma fastidiosa]MDY5167564.1 cyclophilin-like fold protein [Dielma fastidiosa]